MGSVGQPTRSGGESVSAKMWTLSTIENFTVALDWYDIIQYGFSDRESFNVLESEDKKYFCCLKIFKVWMFQMFGQKSKITELWWPITSDHLNLLVSQCQNLPNQNWQKIFEG